MAKLPKNIIKKYGISKKAWSVFRSKKHKPKTTMARRKIKRSRIRTRSYFKAKRHSKRSSGLGSLAGTVIGAMAYGAGRQYVSDKLQPLTAKIPAGQYADEVAMGGLSYLMMKGKIPLINKLKITRDIGKAGLAIEAARLGAGLSSGFMPMVSSTQSGQVYL